MRFSFPIAAFLGLILMTECHAGEARQLKLPNPPARYANVELPSHFKAIAKKYDNTPATNPITDTGAMLGRVLFYDTTLSVNDQTSCASCHKQQFAFTDEKQNSVGFQGETVSRNSMSLVNIRFYKNGKMFWDERAATLEEQVLMPIEDKIEMGHSLPALTKQLQADPIYPPLFNQAFGDDEITEQRIARALAQFVRSIVSYRSKYDVGRGQVDSVHDSFPNFTKSENYGKEQFFTRGNCASCHMEQDPIQSAEYNRFKATYGTSNNAKQTTGKPLKQTALFYMFQPVVNGIDSEETEDDYGVGKHTEKKADLGRFKVPSLRNIELTGPYMHDGRFHMIEQVIEHYNWSVRPHPNLDPRLKDFTEGMAMPEVEKLALHEFLLTLTDKELIKDEKFSDPFVRTAQPK